MQPLAWDGSKVGFRLYDAARVDEFERPPVVVIDETLILAGARFDFISETTLPQPLITENGNILYALFLIGSLDPIYGPTGQQRIEVLWRTMIGDYLEAIPAQVSLNKDFCELIYARLRYGFREFVDNLVETMQRNSPESSVDQIREGIFLALSVMMRNATIDTLNPGNPLHLLKLWILTLCSLKVGNEELSASYTGPYNTIPSLQQALAFARGRTTPEEERYYERLCEKYSFSGFLSRILTMGYDRRLFITSNGILGLGPQSLNCGDEIWLFRGARTPFVLRPSPSGDTYSIVGEVYLHGFMNGEMLNEEMISKFGPVSLR